MLIIAVPAGLIIGVGLRSCKGGGAGGAVSQRQGPSPAPSKRRPARRGYSAADAEMAEPEEDGEEDGAEEGYDDEGEDEYSDEEGDTGEYSDEGDEKDDGKSQVSQQGSRASRTRIPIPRSCRSYEL